MQLWCQIKVVNSRKKKNDSCTLCKLDLEKVYDRVNWDFLNQIILMMGCGDE